MTVYEFNNYRDYLKSALAEKMEKNSNFSLRAMARQSGIAGSTLSEVSSSGYNRPDIWGTNTQEP
jgi:lambda repressor-like predicted transcriptional regulator